MEHISEKFMTEIQIVISGFCLQFLTGNCSGDFYIPINCLSKKIIKQKILNIVRAHLLLYFSEDMDSTAEKEYDAFQERVRRTIYIDNLSPQVNESVLKNGLDQYVNVKGVQFIPNYIEPKNMARCALVEVETSEQAQAIIEDLIGAYPFMILGIPRHVRARPAEAEMFNDRPAKPGRKIKLRWLDPNDPDFQLVQKLKRLVKKHAAEASLMLKVSLGKS